MPGSPAPTATANHATHVTAAQTDQHLSQEPRSLVYSHPPSVALGGQGSTDEAATAATVSHGGAGQAPVRNIVVARVKGGTVVTHRTGVGVPVPGAGSGSGSKAAGGGPASGGERDAVSAGVQPVADEDVARALHFGGQGEVPAAYAAQHHYQQAAYHPSSSPLAGAGDAGHGGPAYTGPYASQLLAAQDVSDAITRALAASNEAVQRAQTSSLTAMTYHAGRSAVPPTPVPGGVPGGVQGHAGLQRAVSPSRTGGEGHRAGLSQPLGPRSLALSLPHTHVQGAGEAAVAHTSPHPHPHIVAFASIPAHHHYGMPLPADMHVHAGAEPLSPSLLLHGHDASGSTSHAPSASPAAGASAPTPLSAAPPAAPAASASASAGPSKMPYAQLARAAKKPKPSSSAAAALAAKQQQLIEDESNPKPLPARFELMPKEGDDDEDDREGDGQGDGDGSSAYGAGSSVAGSTYSSVGGDTAAAQHPGRLGLGLALAGTGSGAPVDLNATLRPPSTAGASTSADVASRSILSLTAVVRSAEARAQQPTERLTAPQLRGPSVSYPHPVPTVRPSKGPSPSAEQAAAAAVAAAAAQARAAAAAAASTQIPPVPLSQSQHRFGSVGSRATSPTPLPSLRSAFSTIPGMQAFAPAPPAAGSGAPAPAPTTEAAGAKPANKAAASAGAFALPVMLHGGSTGDGHADRRVAGSAAPPFKVPSALHVDGQLDGKGSKDAPPAGAITVLEATGADTDDRDADEEQDGVAAEGCTRDRPVLGTAHRPSRPTVESHFFPASSRYMAASAKLIVAATPPIQRYGQGSASSAVTGTTGTRRTSPGPQHTHDAASTAAPPTSASGETVTLQSAKPRSSSSDGFALSSAALLATSLVVARPQVDVPDSRDNIPQAGSRAISAISMPPAVDSVPAVLAAQAATARRQLLSSNAPSGTALAAPPTRPGAAASMHRLHASDAPAMPLPPPMSATNEHADHRARPHRPKPAVAPQEIRVLPHTALLGHGARD